MAARVVMVPAVPAHTRAGVVPVPRVRRLSLSYSSSSLLTARRSAFSSPAGGGSLLMNRSVR